MNDTLLDGGGGTDTLNIGANFTSTSDAQIANIENVTLTAVATTLNLSQSDRGFQHYRLDGRRHDHRRQRQRYNHRRHRRRCHDRRRGRG